ncbi:hypothetical protein [Azospirillum isscasi]|uniref:TldD/PmbA family protein n=1 Tax=Azospirillum isscasi TaxID=3053926 RepID=A0ABU0WHD2_9PROT|nr:hypothetical protein [Azospirillum isscasi]MDQ2103502.1 hypothetical protein [Azospirillum isscasi]
MTDEELARAVRAAVADLNRVLAEAARHGIVVELRTAAHQTGGGTEQVAVEARISKPL